MQDVVCNAINDVVTDIMFYIVQDVVNVVSVVVK